VLSNATLSFPIIIKGAGALNAHNGIHRKIMNLKRRNLLLVIPNLGPGGAQRVFHDHSIALSKYYNVYECVFNKDDGIAYPTQNELIDLRVPAGANIILKIFYFFQRCYRLWKVKKQYKIDVCISHLEGADYVNILSKGKEDTVLCIHGSKLHDLNISGVVGWLRKKILMPLLYNIPDKIITVSRDINPELIHGFGVEPAKIQTINNFFDVNKISRLAEQPLEKFQSLFRNHQVIITSGRLTLQKNQAPLLLIFSRLLKEHASKLVFLGDGELRQELIDYSRSLGLRTFTVWAQDQAADEHDVYFLGYQDNPFQYIKQATVFAFPSSWEGFPMALCEAMICGAPVVTTDCPTGPREILAPASRPNQKIREAELADFGILMPMLHPNDQDQTVIVWVRTLEKLLGDPATRLAYKEKGRLRMNDLTPEKITEQWVEAIEQL
jgi:glycosyltransferase involved in cell wall biosynthesis